MELLRNITAGAVGTVTDLVPIAILFAVFQFAVLRRPLPELGRILVGLVYVVVGLTLFRAGLSMSLIPMGESMAVQLVELGGPELQAGWRAYVPIVVFAASIGFAATLIEPTLIAVADRVRDLSGGIATSVVTVPLIAAYGIAIAEAIPGRSALTDGFGLIVLALMGPAIMLLLFAHGYRVYQNWLKRGEDRAV